MEKENIKKLVKEEVDKQLLELGIKKPKEKKKINYYNPMYMHDSWYGD